MSTYVTFIEPLVEPGANIVELTKRVGKFLAPRRIALSPQDMEAIGGGAPA